jgi:hypothetical protein
MEYTHPRNIARDPFFNLSILVASAGGIRVSGGIG